MIKTPKTNNSRLFRGNLKTTFYSLLIFIISVALLISSVGCANYNLEPFSEDALTVTFIDVGQGDSILLMMNKETMLIDAGTARNVNMVKDYLKSNRITKIDYLIATHPHEDHIGGMADIIDACTIVDMYMPNVSRDTLAYMDMIGAANDKKIEPIYPYSGLVIKLGKAKVTFLSPELETSLIEASDADAHKYCIVLKVEFEECSGLFMGDAEVDIEDQLMAMADISVDVLKVGHHGSKTSTSEEFLDKVSPKYAVISVGEPNQYNHPDKEILDRLSKKKVKRYLTSERGNITFVTNGQKKQSNLITDR